MKGKELLRLVWLNITQNKFKVIMTSIGIIVGAATVVLVIAIGKGGQADVADQFKNLNAGAIDISYDGGDKNKRGTNGVAGMGGAMRGEGFKGTLSAGNAGGFGGGEMPNMSGFQDREMPDMSSFQDGEMPEMPNSFSDERNMFEGNGTSMEELMNQEDIILTMDDLEELLLFADGIIEGTISFSARSSVEGGILEEATTYTIAGVKENYAQISNLMLSVGAFISEEQDEKKEKVCVLGASVAEEIFGSAIEAYGSIIYIDGRQYVVDGVLQTMGTVASGISPDDAIYIPYETGIKYIVGTEVNPTITVIADELDNIEGVITNVTNVLEESYPNAEFTYEDAGSKMQAASASNEILTLLLIAMAAIVFLVGGIGIMNVLFVSVKERTNEIGILKAIGCSQRNILYEFLLEAAAISLIGGIVGVGLSWFIVPAVEYFGVRVEMSIFAMGLALVFSIGTGTLFGFYPAYKASKLVPVEALGAE